MLGINPYKLFLTVRGYESGQRQKNPQNSKPCKGSEEGWEKLPLGRKKRVGKLVACSIYVVRKVAKIFNAGYDLLWSVFMLFIGGRCTLSKIDMHGSD